MMGTYTGKVTAISPSAWTVQYSIIPISEKAISSEAGPPYDSVSVSASHQDATPWQTYLG